MKAVFIINECPLSWIQPLDTIKKLPPAWLESQGLWCSLMTLPYMTSLYPFTPDAVRKISVFLMTLTSLHLHNCHLLVPNTESIGFHKPLHDLPLLLFSAYDKPNFPLLKETVHSPPSF